MEIKLNLKFRKPVPDIHPLKPQYGKILETCDRNIQAMQGYLNGLRLLLCCIPISLVVISLVLKWYLIFILLPLMAWWVKEHHESRMELHFEKLTRLVTREIYREEVTGESSQLLRQVFGRTD